ncbi:hypothetical protein, partial [Clostridium perfringens]
GLVYTTGTPLDAGLRRFGRASYATDEQLDNWTYDNQLTGSVRTGPAVHTLLFGTDRQVAHAREAFAFGSATPIDVYA